MTPMAHSSGHGPARPQRDPGGFAGAFGDPARYIAGPSAHGLRRTQQEENADEFIEWD